MKLRIFGETDENELIFRLVQVNEHIDLEVVDPDGNEIDTILRINSNGTLRLCKGINKELGFQINKGRIRIENGI